MLWNRNKLGGLIWTNGTVMKEHNNSLIAQVVYNGERCAQLYELPSFTGHGFLVPVSVKKKFDLFLSFCCSSVAHCMHHCVYQLAHILLLPAICRGLGLGVPDLTLTCSMLDFNPNPVYLVSLITLLLSHAAESSTCPHIPFAWNHDNRRSGGRHAHIWMEGANVNRIICRDFSS